MRNMNFQQIVKNLNEGKVKKVIMDCERCLKMNPTSVPLLNIYAVALSQYGKPQIAKKNFEKARKLDPKNPSTPLNLGNLYFTLKNFQKAAEQYTEAIKLNPKYVRAYTNLGAAQQAVGLFCNAEKNFERAIELEPKFVEAHFNLAITLRLQNKLSEAKKVYENVLLLNPTHMSALNNLGVLLQETGDIDEAVRVFKMAPFATSKSTKVYLNLCEIYEKSNQLDELEKLLSEIKNIAEDSADDLLFYEALLKFRRDNVEEALRIILKIEEKKLSKSRKGMFFQLKAKCFDKLGDFDAAFQNFGKMNSEYAGSTKIDSERRRLYREMIIERKSDILRFRFKANVTTENLDFEPVFLIGFPRSGTTLTDTILRSHSKISVIEEIPLIPDLAKDILEDHSISEIEQLSAVTLRAARRSYMDRIRDMQISPDYKIIVDKLPMNIVELPFIRALFPRSKIIFVLRHPLDAILSNYMQTFKLNEAMSNFLYLSDAASFYCDVMSLFTACQTRYEIPIHQIRYESLVLDMEEEVTLMLSFLGLEWEANLNKYSDTALKRREIRTPSYSQVIQPLYNTSVYRWQNYKQHLFPECNMVLPWVRKFGYENIV